MARHQLIDFSGIHIKGVPPILCTRCSEVIVAVEQNPEAPIFEIADIGIVGNVQTILPLLIKELKGEAPKERKGQEDSLRG